MDFGNSFLKKKKTPERIASVPAEIQTKHNPNISLQSYRYTSQLGEISVNLMFALYLEAKMA
jgi:hypothetical protein